MSTAVIAALATAIPAILVAVLSFIKSLRATNAATVALGTAVHANTTVNTHLINDHGAFPLQPPDTQDPPHLQAGR